VKDRTKTVPFRLFCLLVTFVTFWLIFRRMDWRGLWIVLKGIQPALYGAGLAWCAASLFLQTYRWRLCLEQPRKTPYRILLRLTTISYFFNNLFIAFFGGDLYRAVNLFAVVGRSQAILSVLLVRITNFWGAAAIPVLMLPFYPALFSEYAVLRLVAVISLIAWLCPLALIVLRQSLPLLLQRIARTPPGEVMLPETVFRAGNLISLALSSIALQAILIAAHFFYARALGIPLGWGSLVIVVPAVLIVTSLPISVNGIGVREGSFVVLLGLMGVRPEQAFALSIMSYSGNLYLSLIGGAIYLTGKIRGR